ncbi:hypothetical protein I3760_04G111000 [Carya illinoinensis]|nr:hypothetical protein I3760_04G111000 [Carya illinoinensis]
MCVLMHLCALRNYCLSICSRLLSLSLCFSDVSISILPSTSISQSPAIS